MNREEELKAELAKIEEAKESAPQPETPSVATESELDLEEVEVELKVNLRRLKDKEPQLKGRFGKVNVMEKDDTRRDGIKTVNTLRNEIDIIKHNIELFSAQLPSDKVEVIKKLIDSEK